MRAAVLVVLGYFAGVAVEGGDDEAGEFSGAG